MVGYIWIAVRVVVLVAVDVTELTYQDLGTRFAVAAAGIAVFLSMGQLILDRVDSWIAGTNYRRLLVGQDDPLLYALILMKTDHPSIPLRTVQGLNPKLFEPQALTESLYK